MSDKAKVIPLTEVMPKFSEWTKQNIEPYVTGLIGIRKFNNSEDVTLIGSGTFVKISEEIYGILTAQHVALEFRKYEQIGLAIAEHEHKCRYDRQYLNIIEVAKPLDVGNYSNGPDLAFIILPIMSIGTLKAM